MTKGLRGRSRGQIFYSFLFLNNPETFFGSKKVKKMIFYYSSSEGGGVKTCLKNVKLFFLKPSLKTGYFFLLVDEPRSTQINHLAEKRISERRLMPLGIGGSLGLQIEFGIRNLHQGQPQPSTNQPM